MSKKWTCPECGAHNKFETNGEALTSASLSVCCSNRVPATEAWWKDYAPGVLPEDVDADGKVRCGNQWDPNDM